MLPLRSVGGDTAIGTDTGWAAKAGGRLVTGEEEAED